MKEPACALPLAMNGREEDTIRITLNATAVQHPGNRDKAEIGVGDNRLSPRSRLLPSRAHLHNRPHGRHFLFDLDELRLLCGIRMPADLRRHRLVDLFLRDLLNTQSSACSCV